MRTRAAKTILSMVAGVVALTGCGSSGDNVAEDEPTITTSEAVAVDGGSEETDDDGSEQDPQDDPPPPAFDTLVTEPTEPGPRPLLAWASVDGATIYDLIVLDAAGSPYWAWSGEDTSVYLGGVENPDAVGAWVFEPLTWIVTARDGEGQPLAMSESAELVP